MAKIKSALSVLLEGDIVIRVSLSAPLWEFPTLSSLWFDSSGIKVYPVVLSGPEIHIRRAL